MQTPSSTASRLGRPRMLAPRLEPLPSIPPNIARQSTLLDQYAAKAEPSLSQVPRYSPEPATLTAQGRGFAHPDTTRSAPPVSEILAPAVHIRACVSSPAMSRVRFSPPPHPDEVPRSASPRTLSFPIPVQGSSPRTKSARSTAHSIGTHFSRARSVPGRRAKGDPRTECRRRSYMICGRTIRFWSNEKLESIRTLRFSASINQHPTPSSNRRTSATIPFRYQFSPSH